MTRRTMGLMALVAALAIALPAGAITNGEPDNSEHPYVGQLLFHVPDDVDPRFDDPGSWFNCTGTLISPTVLVTAGHCTYAIGLNGESTTTAPGGDGSGGNDVWLNFGEVPDYNGFPASGDYARDKNDDRYADREEWLDDHGDWIRGTSNPHPDYIDAAFFLFDMGVVVLDSPVILDEYAELPALGLIDTFLSQPKNTQRFTAVGYGLRLINPVKIEFGDERYKNNMMLIGSKGVFGLPEGISVKFSNNNGKAHRGGTCFGDSGGPNFVAGTTTIAAITSFGINGNCAGTGGGYRIDKAVDLAFINSFLTPS